MYSNFETLKEMYNSEIIPNRDIEKRRNKLIPETKINIIQLNIINNV